VAVDATVPQTHSTQLQIMHATLATVNAPYVRGHPQINALGAIQHKIVKSTLILLHVTVKPLSMHLTAKITALSNHQQPVQPTLCIMPQAVIVLKYVAMANFSNFSVMMEILTMEMAVIPVANLSPTLVACMATPHRQVFARMMDKLPSN
jgi:hypothetical protein